MNKRGQVGLISIDAFSLPKWLLYPLVVLVCLTLLAVVFFLGVVGYSCLKGDCNAYYGMGWFGYRHYPMVSYQSQVSECWENGVQVDCKCLDGFDNSTECKTKCYNNGRFVDC